MKSNTQSMQEQFLQILNEQIQSIHKALKNADPKDPHTIKLHRLLLGYMREFRQMEKHADQNHDGKRNGKNKPKHDLVVKEVPVDLILQAAKRHGNGNASSQQDFMKEIEDRIRKESGKQEQPQPQVSKNTALLAKPA